MKQFNLQAVVFFLGLVFFSSVRHHSALIGSEESNPETIRRVGLLSDSGELENSIPEAPALNTANLPARCDLSSQLPQAYSQGNQASSVGFALGYAIKSYTENKKSSKPVNLSKLSVKNPDDQKYFFSPKYIYNATNQGKDQGGSLLQGLVLLSSQGILSWSELPYTYDDYRSRTFLNEVGSIRNRIFEFRRISPHKIQLIKAYLRDGHPLPASVLFYSDYTGHNKGQVLSKPNGEFMGVQAVVLAGYDDSKKAFKFLNSWGNEWGDDGYGWIDYKLFQRTVQSIYWVNDPSHVPSPSDFAKSYPNEITASRGNYPDRVRVSWSQVRGAVGYEIYRKRTSEEKYQLVGLSVDRSFEDRGVQPELAYHYTVGSVFQDDSSSPSPGYAEGFATKSQKQAVMEKITGLVASQGKFADRIHLTWDAIPGAREYHVYKFNRYSNEFRVLGKTNKPEFIDRKAQRNGNLEFYRVSLAGNTANSSLSDSVLGYTTSRSLALPPPDEIEASKGDHSDKISLQWQGIPGAVDYKIYRYSLTSKIWEELANTTATFFEDVSPVGNTHYYSVASANKLGIWSRGSVPVLGSIALTRDRSNTLIPPNLIETKIIKLDSDQLLRLNWKPVKDAKAYSIYTRKVGGSWTKIGDTAVNYYQTALPREGSFQLYSVASVNELQLEGRKSTSVAFGYIPSQKDEVLHRSFGQASKLEKFKGPWTSMYWDGKANVTQVQLVIDANDEMNQTCKIKFNNRLIYEGEYIQETKIIDPQGSFQIAIGETDEALFMEIRDKKIFKENTSLSFLRE